MLMNLLGGEFWPLSMTYEVVCLMQIKSVSGKKDLPIIYPGVMLNVMVAKHNTNDQYQELVDPVNKVYKTTSQMSIEFEVDGPYKVSYVLPILHMHDTESHFAKRASSLHLISVSLRQLKGHSSEEWVIHSPEKTPISGDLTETLHTMRGFWTFCAQTTECGIKTTHAHGTQSLTLGTE